LTAKLFREACAASPGLLEPEDEQVVRDMVRSATLWLPPALTDYDVERHLVREAEGITFHGYADLIVRVPGQPPLILDWKTGRHVYAPEETRQLGLYSWMWGQERTTVRLVFLREGRALEAEVSREEAEEAGAWAVDLVREILAKGDDPEAFSARPNGLCAWCHLRDECSAAGEWVAPGVIGSLEEAQEEARRLLVQEAVVKGRRDALARWAKANGTFTAEGQEFGCFPTRELEADPKAVIEVAELLGFGQEAWAAVALASAKAESLMRRHPELDGLITWREKPGYFRHRRANKEGDGVSDS
ncbi:MAG: PD-(D/E)XK nuclease family protein, partial [Thermaerobacter sp.]|nr:PD-(D/E)XK nuclease family protein [Thermaerobacter sp.]